MTHFEYMQQTGHMDIFELLDEYELIPLKQSSTPRKVGYCAEIMIGKSYPITPVMRYY